MTKRTTKITITTVSVLLTASALLILSQINRMKERNHGRK